MSECCLDQFDKVARRFEWIYAKNKLKFYQP